MFPVPWIIFDVPNIAHAALYTTGHLENGTIYGVLKKVLSIQEQFMTEKVVFAFDSGCYNRRELFPAYKRAREEKKLHGPPEAIDTYVRYWKEITALKDEILPRVGFKNIFCHEGFEADDILASIAGIPELDPILLVSRDSDILQLLSPTTEIWLPVDNRLVTYDGFITEYGLSPSQWIDVKAITGCNTDGIPGVPGVGIKTAVKYLTGQLKKGAAFDKIVASQEIINRNVKLVRLPYRRCPTFWVGEDALSRDAWKETMRKWRMSSLTSSFPKGCVA